jgi:subtilisin family serine protease
MGNEIRINRSLFIASVVIIMVLFIVVLIVRRCHIADQTFVDPSRQPLAHEEDKFNYIVSLDEAYAFDNNTIETFRGRSRQKFENAEKGFAGSFNAQEIEQLRNTPGVIGIENDFGVFAARVGNTRNGPRSNSIQRVDWGIPRLGANKSSTESGNGSGTIDGVEVYVLDTGCTHKDLNIVEEVSFATGESSTRDRNGHGTHVAGIICARDNSEGSVGVAPSARLHAIKVLNRNGAGWLSDVIAGVDYVVRSRDPSRPTIINLSLGAYTGSTSYNALDRAVKTAVDAGITVCVAAGNDYNNASLYTPAHVVEALTVAAYDETNRFAWFSNWGSMVDLCAPGVDILSLWSDGSVKILSGTSMAAPYVAGAAALVLASNPSATPAQVRQILMNAAANPSFAASPQETAANPSVTGVPTNTTNVSVFSGNF